MTVEMERPFVWPQVPENLDEWNQKQIQAAENEQKEYQEKSGRSGDTVPVAKSARESMADQAKRLLEGKETWRPTPVP